MNIQFSTTNFKSLPGLIALLIPDQKHIYILKSSNVTRTVGQTVALLTSKDRRFPNSIHLAASTNGLSLQVEVYSPTDDKIALGLLQNAYTQQYRSNGWVILNTNKPPKYYLRILPQTSERGVINSWHVIVRSAGKQTGPTIAVFPTRSEAVDWVRQYYGVNVLKGAQIEVGLVYSSNALTRSYLRNPLVNNRLLKEELDVIKACRS